MKNKIIIFIIFATIMIGGYYVKEHYFYAGHEYVGEWSAGNSHMTITHQGNHFIFNWNGKDSKFHSAHLTQEQSLQVGEHKENVMIYLESDDAIQFAGSYYKRMK